VKTLLKKFASATLNFPLMGVLVIGNVIFVLIALFGLLLDTRTILSAPVWAKTFKFALSAIVIKKSKKIIILGVRNLDY
jgi:hypothetical protein